MRDQRGSVTVLVAAMATCLLLAAALTVDVGRLYVRRARLQAVADAAALAGAQALPDEDRARALAREYAGRNGVPAEVVQVEVDPRRRAVRVWLEGVESIAFAGVLGVPAVRILADSAAEQAPAAAVRGAQPLGVELTDFVLGEVYRLKLGPQSTGGGPRRGNFHALALGGPGADRYRRNLAYGYPGWLAVGDEVETEPGNMQGPTEQGLRDRLRADPYSTWDRPLANSPRVLLVPVIEGFGVAGRKTVRIAGFAAFFLEEVRSGEVTGRFIRWTVLGRAAADALADYGARVVRLVD